MFQRTLFMHLSKYFRYLPIFQIIKPTIRTLSEYYMSGNMKRKILYVFFYSFIWNLSKFNQMDSFLTQRNMRIDTIGQMLTFGNIAATRNVMVLESCKGLILSAIAERLGGHGKIINFSPNGGDNSTK